MNNQATLKLIKCGIQCQVIPRTQPEEADAMWRYHVP